MFLLGKGLIFKDIAVQGHDAVQNDNGATITINGGIFGDSDADITNQNNINRGPGIRNYGTATLNGGKFTAGDNYLNSGWAYAVINQGGSITINSGVIVYGKNNGNIGNTAGDMTVNGGSFTINGPKSHYNIYSSGGSINVVGGTFTNSTSSTTFKLGGGTVSVTGGTFNKQPEAAIIADGYEAVDNGNGTWTVQELQSVAQIGDS